MFGRKKKMQAQIEELRNELDKVKDEASFPFSSGSSSMEDFIKCGLSGGSLVTSKKVAMGLPAVFACVRLIAGAVSSSPVRIFRSGGNEEEFKHPYKALLSSRPNEFMTAATFWKVMAQNKVLAGNAYAVIMRNKSGGVKSLHPIAPRNVTPYQAWELGLDKRIGVNQYRLYYYVTWDNGECTVVDQDDMLHIPNLDWDGKKGLSTLSAAARTLGIAVDSEKSASSLFKNGLVTQTAITYPNKMGEEQQEKLRDFYAKKYATPENHYKPLILTQGGKPEPLSISPVDSQLIESRQFSTIDIARLFGVPPVMIGESTKTSSWGSGVEQMARWFATFTMNEHFTAIEQEINTKIFTRGTFRAEFDEKGLTRGDTKTRGDFYRIMRGSLQEPGVMTINEIRKAEGLPPVEGGDEILRPETEDSENVDPE